MMERKWIVAAFGNFGVAALLGLVLRCVPLVEIPWLNFRHVTHAHSHAAMMGWLYMAIFGLVLHTFLPEKERTAKLFRWLFWILQFAVMGMVCSFPFQGYGAVSITFSAIHLFASYTFLVAVWKKLSNVERQPKLLLKTAIVLMIFSTLGVYAIGPATVFAGRFSDLYNLCIQFFLHFQFQGWFFFALLAIFFQRMHVSGRNVLGKNAFFWFYSLLLFACFGMMALPTAQYLGWEFLLPLNTVGAIAQLAAVLILLTALNKFKHAIGNSSFVIKIAVWAVVVSLFVKAIGQAALSWPSIAIAPVLIRPMVVGFIHLLLLSAASFFIIGSLSGIGVFSDKANYLKMGSIGLLIGIVITEVALFVQAFSIWTETSVFYHYHEVLLLGSIFLVAGVFVLFSAIVSEPKAALS